MTCVKSLNGRSQRTTLNAVFNREQSNYTDCEELNKTVKLESSLAYEEQT